MKKGILFTLSLVIIVSLVLALALLNFKNVQISKERLAETGSLERLSSLSNSIATGFKKIFNAYTEINVTSNNQTVTFEEFLPNENAATFNSNLDNYKSYIESRDNNIVLNITMLKQDLPLNVLPYNLIHKHIPFGGDTMIFNPSQSNYNKYKVEIEPVFAITTCNWNTYPGSVSFELDANAPGCDNTQNIDTTRNNTIDINNGGVLIIIYNNLSIENNLASSKFKVTIEFNKIDNERLIVSSDKNVININYKELNISKSSGFRIV